VKTLPEPSTRSGRTDKFNETTPFVVSLVEP
jgi:hypothetical protein